MQLQFLRYILNIVKERLAVFHTTLIKEGKTTALLHGLMSFFKNLFSNFKISQKDLTPYQFNEWRAYFNDMIQICLEIAKVCTTLLSNNRVDLEEGEMGIDSRGHPMQK